MWPEIIQTSIFLVQPSDLIYVPYPEFYSWPGLPSQWNPKTQNSGHVRNRFQSISYSGCLLSLNYMVQTKYLELPFIGSFNEIELCHIQARPDWIIESRFQAWVTSYKISLRSQPSLPYPLASVMFDTTHLVCWKI